MVDNHSERGQPIHSTGRDITPVARVTRVTWPGGRFEWHRPVAVEIRAGDRVRRVPIRDVTRLYTLAGVFACLMLGGAIAVWAFRARPARRTGR
jgi:hypothetical protein